VRRGILVACLGAVASISSAGAGRPQENDALVVEVSGDEIGLFYDGARVAVSFEVDSGTEVALVVAGPASDLRLRTQARVWGTFWAPSGEVTFPNIPSLYILQTSVALDDLASESVRRALGVGYGSLQPAVERASARKFFPELIRLKESEGLFRSSIGALHPAEAVGGVERVATSLAVGPRAPPGAYRVRVLTFRAGQLAREEEATFTLWQGPLVAGVSSLAREHGLLYGIVAVVVAVAAGLGVGFVFGSVKGH
jgi:uncharacterized protein (TIGR02186 family)